MQLILIIYFIWQGCALHTKACLTGDWQVTYVNGGAAVFLDLPTPAHLTKGIIYLYHLVNLPLTTVSCYLFSTWSPHDCRTAGLVTHVTTFYTLWKTGEYVGQLRVFIVLSGTDGTLLLFLSTTCTFLALYELGKAKCCHTPDLNKGRPGVRFTKQVQQPLSLILNAGLIYSEIENSGISVPQHRFWVNLINSV